MRENCFLCLSTFSGGGPEHGLSSLLKLVQGGDEGTLHDDDDDGDGVFVLCPPCEEIMDAATVLGNSIAQLQIRLKTEIQRIRNIILETKGNSQTPENIRKMRKSFIKLTDEKSIKNGAESINYESMASVQVKIEEEEEINQFEDDLDGPCSPSAFMITPEEEDEGMNFDELAIKLENSDDEGEKKAKSKAKKTRGEPSRRSTRIRQNVINDNPASQDQKPPSPQKKAARIIYKKKKTSAPRSGPAQKFLCVVCDRKFNKGIKLYIHMFKKHETEEKPFSCPDSTCNKKFTLEINLQRHIELHEEAEQKPMVCEFCDTRFSTQARLDVHLQYHKGFTCKFCSKLCGSYAGLTVHLRHHTGARPYACPYPKCKERFIASHLRKNHIEKVHQKGTKHPCNLCDASFNTTAGLQNHLARHAKVGCFADLKCEDEGCQEVFKSKTPLENHMIKVHGRDPFICDQCGAALASAGGLKAHKRMHIDIRKFKCDICQAAFKKNYLLKLHVKIHSAERPYVCSFCGNAFKSKKTLSEHEKRIHSKEFIPNYKFTCPHCPNKQFEWKSVMEYHIRQFHTDEKPFACHVQSCNQSFALKSALTQHLKSHGIINRVLSSDRAPRTKRDVNLDSSRQRQRQKRMKRDQNPNEDEESNSSSSNQGINNEQILFENQLYYQNL